MTRFQNELSGMLGEFWKKSAERELAEINSMIENGNISIDKKGVARNKIGRVVDDELLEKISYINESVSIVETRKARLNYVQSVTEKYINKNSTISNSEKLEMTSVFGSGSTVIDVISNKEIML